MSKGTVKSATRDSVQCHFKSPRKDHHKSVNRCHTILSEVKVEHLQESSNSVPDKYITIECHEKIEKEKAPTPITLTQHSITDVGKVG